MKEQYIEENIALSKAKVLISENIDKMIAENNVKCAVESINDKNVFELIDLFESITDRLYEGEGKKLIGKYTKFIKENKGVRDSYNIYKALKSNTYPKQETFVSSFINEATSFFPKGKELKLDKIKSVVKEAVSILGISTEELDSILKENEDFRKNVNYLATEKKTTSNLFEYASAINSIINHIFENTEEIDSEEPMNQEELVEFIIGVGGEDSDVDNEMLNDIVECKLCGKTDSEIFEGAKEKCLNTINKAIEEENSVENKARLSSIKEGLEKKAYNKDTYYEDLPKMYELKKMF